MQKCAKLNRARLAGVFGLTADGLRHFERSGVLPVQPVAAGWYVLDGRSLACLALTLGARSVMRGEELRDLGRLVAELYATADQTTLRPYLIASPSGGWVRGFLAVGEVQPVGDDKVWDLRAIEQRYQSVIDRAGERPAEVAEAIRTAVETVPA